MRATLLSLAVILGTPSLALAAPKTFSEFVAMIVGIIDTGTGLLILAAIVIYFFSVSTSLIGAKNRETSQKLKTVLSWGIIVIFVMVSIWGIIRLLRTTLLLNDPYDAGSSSGGSQLDADPFMPPEFSE